jgi:hypothetical protein
LTACQDLFYGNSHFLDGGSLEGNKIGMTGFPRSGTTFLRKTIEQMTGLATGSTVNLYTSTLL